MKTTFLLSTCLVPALVILPLRAEDDRPGPPPPGPLLEALDANGDHQLSEDEIANAAAALRELDHDNDGTIDLKELRPPRDRDHRDEDRNERDRPPHRPAPPVIAALDRDRDGVISAEELEGSAKALAELDRDGDGELTPRELHPGPPPGMQGEGRERRRPRGDDNGQSGPPQGFDRGRGRQGGR